MKNQRNFVLLGILILVLILLYVLVFSKKSPEQQVSMNAPIDVALDFYGQWSEKLGSPDTDPYKSGLSESLILSPELRQKIKLAKNNSEVTIDPVLCQPAPIPDFVTRIVQESEDLVQLLITAKDPTLTGQSVMTLLKYNEGWFINDITCSPGEFGEDREFSFEKSGFLLKGASIASDVNSLDPKLWYIIFEDNGNPGNNAALLFDTESKCVNKNGEEKVCVPDEFTEVAKVSVQGQMLEWGVDVINLKMN